MGPSAVRRPPGERHVVGRLGDTLGYGRAGGKYLVSDEDVIPVGRPAGSGHDESEVLAET